ncbi:MAG: hypothetical protein JO110_20300 [Acetobacteraceae bacterium]|nr:hypothetical protein [Acetobacteraceae bacterium]
MTNLLPGLCRLGNTLPGQSDYSVDGFAERRNPSSGAGGQERDGFEADRDHNSQANCRPDSRKA